MNNSYYWMSPWQWTLYLHWSDWFGFIYMGFLFGLLITRVVIVKEERTTRGYLQMGLFFAATFAVVGFFLMVVNGPVYFFEWSLG